MDKFIQLLTLMLAEAKDPATLLKRILTIFVTVLLYLSIAHTGEVVSFLRAFSTNSVIEDMRTQRVTSFPTVAREKSMILFSQTEADAVFVVKYKPDGINDYQNIIAWEGKQPLDKGDMEDRPVNKASQLYKRQLEGFNYSINNEVKVIRYNGVDIPSLRNITFNYVYTCPYFNLNNIYAGYIGIAYTELPVPKAEMAMFEDYLSRLCSSQQRYLGRAI